VTLARDAASRLAVAPPIPGVRRGRGVERQRGAGRARGVGCGVPGPHLPERLRAQLAGRRAGRELLTAHQGYPIPSPALLARIGNRFRAAVHRFVSVNRVPLVRFAKDERKLDRVRPLLAGVPLAQVDDREHQVRRVQRRLEARGRGQPTLGGADGGRLPEHRCRLGGRPGRRRRRPWPFPMG
jgi:hypothetical protein